MSSFDDFLAEQEKIQKQRIDEQKQAEANARQQKQSAEDSWKQVQAFVMMLTKDKIILGRKFEWRPSKEYPPMLVLDPLAAVFQDSLDNEQYIVQFGHILGNEHLWDGEIPTMECRSVFYSGGGRWGLNKSTAVLGGTMDYESTAQTIAEEFTKHYLDYRLSTDDPK